MNKEKKPINRIFMTTVIFPLSFSIVRLDFCKENTFSWFYIVKRVRRLILKHACFIFYFATLRCHFRELTQTVKKSHLFDEDKMPNHIFVSVLVFVHPRLSAVCGIIRNSAVDKKWTQIIWNGRERKEFSARRRGIPTQYQRVLSW